MVNPFSCVPAVLIGRSSTSLRLGRAVLLIPIFLQKTRFFATPIAASLRLRRRAFSPLPASGRGAGGEGSWGRRIDPTPRPLSAHPETGRGVRHRLLAKTAL